MTDKNYYRQNALDARRQISAKAKAEFSEHISKQTTSILNSIPSAKVHIYISYKNEPQTTDIIKYLLNSNRHVFVPVIKNKIMHSALITDMNFKISEFGILEPQNINIQPVDTEYDVIIVPTLAFDSKLNRMGYGKGYYDRFLFSQPNAKKIGLSYECNKVECLPTDKYDIPLDSLITEDKIY